MKTLECKEIKRSLPPVLKETDTVALDLELSGLKEGQLHRPFGRMLSLACTFDGETAYIIFEEDEVAEFLSRIQKATWVFHNSAFDLGHLRRWAVVPERKNMRDTLLIERLLWSNYYDDFDLKAVVRRYLKCYMPKDIRKEFHDLEGAMTQEQVEYAALDVIGTWHVDKAQQQFMDETNRALWNNLYNPHVWTTLELGGFKLDVEMWRDLAEGNQKIVDEISEDLGKQFGTMITKEKFSIRKPASPKTKEQKKRYEEKFKEYMDSWYEEKTFVPFNPNSHPQVKKILLDKYGIDVESTDEDHLQPYYETNEFVNKMLDYRKAEKQVSTYGLSFLRNVEDDDRIYTSLNIGLAESGRDCVHGDTILETSLGDFAVSDLPLTALGSCSILTHTGNQQKILRKIYKGKEEMFEVTLDNGSKIKCTKGHKFLTAKGWKHLYELKENDRLLDPPLPN